MPTQWTIPASGVDPNTNGKTLAGYHLQENSTNYQFESANGDVLTTSTGATLPALPFVFPVYYKTPFGGTTRLPWYIRVDTTTDGEGNNKAKGEWSNSPFPAPGGKVKRTEADAWHTQAGQNTGVDPEEASAASASSDL